MEPQGPVDERRTATGWPRIFIFAVAVYAGIFVWRSIVAGTQDALEGLGLTAALTWLSALVWIAGAAGLVHNGKKMRWVALFAMSLNVVMPLLGLAVSDFPVDRVSPWFDGGATYFYVPTVLAVGAVAWLFHSAPSRLAQQNG